MNNYQIGDCVKCEVTGTTNYGIFVKVDDDYDGLIHISEISNKFVNDISKKFLVNDIIEAQIIGIDEEQKHLKLSIKKLKKKKKRGTIEENGDGFKPLQDNLGTWIEEKLSELNK